MILFKLFQRIIFPTYLGMAAWNNIYSLFLETRQSSVYLIKRIVWTVSFWKCIFFIYVLTRIVNKEAQNPILFKWAVGARRAPSWSVSVIIRCFNSVCSSGHAALASRLYSCPPPAAWRLVCTPSHSLTCGELGAITELSFNNLLCPNCLYSRGVTTCWLLAGENACL